MLPALPVDGNKGPASDKAKPAAKSTGKASKSAARPASASKRAKPATAKAKTAAVKAKPSGKPAGKAAKPRAVAETASALPVREGEERWTPAELAEVRTALVRESAALEAEITTAASQIAEGDAADGAGDDQADTGAKTYAREHELALTYNARDLLNQAERAVQRIDSGTYGTCESCGRPAGKARLQAFPRATLCVSCKQREERR